MNISHSLNNSFYKSLSRIKARKDLAYILITVIALAAFEAFNFSTTDFALSDLLGDLRFMGVRWALLLSIAFCGIDFAGIARLFSPQNTAEQGRSGWFLFGAWFLAGTMNAILTWWGVVMAMQTHAIISESLMEKDLISRVVPIFIALMVWVIRVLLIGTLSKKSGELQQKNLSEKGQTISRRELRQAQSRAAHGAFQEKHSVPAGFSKTGTRKQSHNKTSYRPEPSYIPLQDEPLYHSMKAASRPQQRR